MTMPQGKENIFTKQFLSKVLEKYIYCSSSSSEYISWQKLVLGFEEVRDFPTIQVRGLKFILEFFNYFPDCLQFVNVTNIDVAKLKKRLSIIKRMLSIVERIEHPLLKAVLMDCIYEYNQLIKDENITQNIRKYPKEIVEYYYDYCCVDHKIETLNFLLFYKYFPRLLNFTIQFNNRDVLSRIEKAVVDLICNITKTDACSLNALYVILEAQNKFPQNPDNANILANKFKQFAHYYYQQRKWKKAEPFVRYAEHYYKKVKKDLEVASMQSLKADIFVERGKLCDNRGEQDISVSYWYNEALIIYNAIASKYREALKIDKKIEVVKTLVFKSKPLIVNSLLNSTKIDLPLPSKSDIYEKINGKNFIEALWILLAYTDQLDGDLPKSELDIIARKKIITPDYLMQNDSNNSMFLLGFIDYMGSIINCFRLAIKETHPQTEEDFFNLAQQSTIVPPVDQSLYARALYLGYIGELYTAIYLLAPKIENLFRVYLNNRGVTVYTTNKDGNERYVVLDKLLDEAEKQGDFNSKFVNTLRKIFTEQGGAQIRHRVAHGLLNEDDSEHMLAYAWALGLKIILLFTDQDK